MGENLPPSRFGAGYTYGGQSEPETPTGFSAGAGWPTSPYSDPPPAHSYSQPAIPLPPGTFGAGTYLTTVAPNPVRRDGSRMAILIGVAVIVLTGGGLLAAHLVTSRTHPAALTGLAVTV